MSEVNIYNATVQEIELQNDNLYLRAKVWSMSYSLSLYKKNLEKHYLLSQDTFV